MRIAIIVPTADAGREPASRCISRVRETAPGAELHVIQSSGAEFRFSRSINRGFAQAPDADAWVLLNDDCFMDAGWLEQMVAASIAHPGVGAVGAVLRYPSGKLQHAGGYLMHPPGYLWYQLRHLAPLWALRNLRAHWSRNLPLVGHYRRVQANQRLDFLTAACLLVTRQCRERLIGFDEEYEFGYEDVDFCFRALEGGLELALATGATGIHLHRATGGGLRAEALRSMETFARKWPTARAEAALKGRHGVYHAAE